MDHESDLSSFQVAEADRQARLQAEHLVHHDLLQITGTDQAVSPSIAFFLEANRTMVFKLDGISEIGAHVRGDP